MAKPTVTWKGTPHELQVIVAALKIAGKAVNYHRDGIVSLGAAGAGSIDLNKIVPGSPSNFIADAHDLVLEIGM